MPSSHDPIPSGTLVKIIFALDQPLHTKQHIGKYAIVLKKHEYSNVYTVLLEEKKIYLHRLDFIVVCESCY